MRSWREWLPRVLVESALIVFSILLALAADGWWESRKERLLAEQALDSFIQEIRANRESLQRIMPYHAGLYSQFQALSSAGPVLTFGDLRRIEGFQGFRPAFLTDTAWRTALATGALVHMDYEIVARLSALYTLQQRFVETSRPDFIQGAGAWTDANIGSTVLSALLYLGDVTAGEQGLLESYELVLNALGAGDDG